MLVKSDDYWHVIIKRKNKEMNKYWSLASHNATKGQLQYLWTEIAIWVSTRCLCEYHAVQSEIVPSARYYYFE